MALEHLGEQILRDGALAAGELGGEALGIGMPGKRERREAQAGRPALGPRLQQLKGGIGQFYPGRLEQRARLLDRKAKIAGADLREPPFQAQAVQPQPQVVARGEHQAELLGRAHQEELELAQRVLGTQLVKVVDHKPDRLLERLQILEQSLDDRPAVEIRRARQLPHQ